MRIVMDLPIMQSSRFACDPSSLCAPEVSRNWARGGDGGDVSSFSFGSAGQACIIPETIIESPKCTMGPHFASTTKPSAEGIDVEADGRGMAVGVFVTGTSACGAQHSIVLEAMLDVSVLCIWCSFVIYYTVNDVLEGFQDIFDGDNRRNL